MSGLLFTLGAFAVAIGVLVTVHEFGHFWVARRLGVKVLRFSIGFGRPLLRWHRRGDETEYVIAAVPLGGYVKMLGEGDEEEVPAEELHRAFNRKPLRVRAAVVVAGPLFNLLFAVVAYWLMFMVGITGLKPVVGEVAPGGVAAVAGIHAGDTIVSVGGRKAAIWENTAIALLDGAVRGAPVQVVTRGSDGRESEHTLKFPAGAELGDEDGLFSVLGLKPWQPTFEARLDEVTPGEAAARAGLKKGDLLLTADGQPLSDWNKWVEYIRAHPGARVRIGLERDGQPRQVDVTLASQGNCGKSYGHLGAGIRIGDHDPYAGMRQTVNYGPLAAVEPALAKSGEMSLLTLRLIGKMIQGQVSLRNLSGPVTIAKEAGRTASFGLARFLDFLAVVSISLGVLNLLPIPILDGGHLLYYLVESATGRPLSERVQQAAQRVGIALLMLLMLLALYNDLHRLFC